MDGAADLARRLAGAVHDPRVLDAVAHVARERFVPESLRDRAYENVALPIACGQTISQPLVVARMLELLELAPTDRVLDVGTGSGYHAALLGLLVAEVWTIERHPELSATAATALGALDCANVHCVTGDGTDGLPEHAPYNAINIAAAHGVVPPTLVSQLAADGRLVLPLGRRRQHLTRMRRTAEGLRVQRLDAVRFVPLVRGAPA